MGLNGWRLLVGSYIIGSILFLLIAESFFNGSGCWKWKAGATDVTFLEDFIIGMLYPILGVGIAGILWGLIDFFIKIELRRRQRP